MFSPFFLVYDGNYVIKLVADGRNSEAAWAKLSVLDALDSASIQMYIG